MSEDFFKYNIDEKEARLRKHAGYLFLGLAITMSLTIWMTELWPLGYFLFFFYFFGLLGIFQGQKKTCVFYALCNLQKREDGLKKVDSYPESNYLKKISVNIGVPAFLWSLLITILVTWIKVYYLHG